MTSVRAALVAAASFGPYFSVAFAGTGRPVGELYDGTALGPLIDDVTAAIDAPEPRIGASILFQGYAARLWSLTLGPALTGGIVPDLAPDRLRWQAVRGSLTLALDPAEGRPATNDRVFRTVVDQHLFPLGDALRAHVRLPDALLWGNAASALVGTAGILGVQVGELLERPPLAGTIVGSLRRSCCLYYKVPGGGFCGDCALR